MTEKKKIKLLKEAGIERDFDMYEIEETGDSYEIYSLFGDILGCILVGKEHKDINNDGLKDVTSSKSTINLLYSIVEEPVYINIINEV